MVFRKKSFYFAQKITILIALTTFVVKGSAEAHSKKIASCNAILVATRSGHFLASLSRKNTSDAIDAIRGFRICELGQPLVGQPQVRQLFVQNTEDSPASKRALKKFGEQLRGIEIHYQDLGKPKTPVHIVAGTHLSGSKAIEAYYRDYESALKHQNAILAQYKHFEFIQLGVGTGSLAFAALPLAASIGHPDVLSNPALLAYTFGFGMIASILSPDMWVRWMNSFDSHETHWRNAVQGFIDQKKTGWLFDSYSYRIPRKIAEQIWLYGKVQDSPGHRILTSENAGFGERLAWFLKNLAEESGSMSDRLEKHRKESFDNRLFVTVDRLLAYKAGTDEMSHTTFLRFSLGEPIIRHPLRFKLPVFADIPAVSR